MCSHWELSENVTQFDYSKLYTATDITKYFIIYDFFMYNCSCGKIALGVRRLKRVGLKGQSYSGFFMNQFPLGPTIIIAAPYLHVKIDDWCRWYRGKFINFLRVFFLAIYSSFFNTALSAAPQIPRCRRMLGWNPVLFATLALTVRRSNHAQLDLIHLLTAIKLIARVSGTGDQQCQQYQIAGIFNLSLQ
jgi:hypothetical protein